LQMDVLLQDLRYAFRSLWRSPIVTAVPILTLSLGIGVVAALFPVVNAVLPDPIVSDQDRVVRVSKIDTQRGEFPFSLSLPEFRSSHRLLRVTESRLETRDRRTR